MFGALFHNKPLFIVLVITGIVALSAIALGVFIVAPDITRFGQKPTPALSLQVKKYPAVDSISPEEYVLLTPEKPQVFRVTLRGYGDISKLRATVSQSLISNPEKISTVPVTTSFEPQARSIVVTTNSPILPLSTYALTIQNPGSSNPVLAINYHSGDTSPTPVISNNPALQQFLPHETGSYILTYSKAGNVYVFNFKIDPESDLSLSSQYEAAKDNATQFITSKGVPIDSITIEWKRH